MSKTLTISKAKGSDNFDLTSLTKASKGYWGFSEELMKKWEKELTITSEYIRDNEVFVGRITDQLIGYYSFKKESPDEILLDNIFIHPTFIKQGFGHQLMVDFFDKVEGLNPRRLLLYSEPKAQLFYERYGFVVTGQWPSPIPNRFLPIMEKTFN